MKIKLFQTGITFCLSLLLFLFFSPFNGYTQNNTIADHEIIRMLYEQAIPESAIQNAIETLRIGYGHTSHGSQITSGMKDMVEFANNNWNTYEENLFAFDTDGRDKKNSPILHLYEGSSYGDGSLERDCGYKGWDDETRDFLDSHPEYNVIMWSWCGQVDSVDIETHYLANMAKLEAEYPRVTFIYMTGHVEGKADDLARNGVLRNNNIIRDYCRTNNKWLFDFADIEKYNLDGDYFGDKLVNDNCDYDSDGNGSRDANWAIEWQNTHTEDTDWYNCRSAHSQPLNANQKAYAAWWLFARIAGWNGIP